MENVRFQMISAAAALVLAGMPAAGRAQALTLAAGSRGYGDAGSSLVVALRAEYPITPTFLLEGAGSISDPVNGVRSVTSLFEVQAQGQLPGGRVVPYFGVGAGIARFAAFGLDPVQRTLEPLLSAGVGARVALSRELGLVADARVRGPESTHLDVTVGVRYRFQ